MTYIEFDFVAVLEMPSNCNISQRLCQGCMVMNNLPWDEGLLHSYGHVAKMTSNGSSELDLNYSKEGYLQEDPIARVAFDSIFKREINMCLVSSCSCHEYLSESASINNIHCTELADSNCEKCIINKPTGCLQIDTSTEVQECSFF